MNVSAAWLRPPVICLALFAAACASLPGSPAGRTNGHVTLRSAVRREAAVAVSTPGLTSDEREAKAVYLLGRGEARAARAEVITLLAARPSSASARTLLDEIDKDPKVMLGERSFPYVAKPGDTMASLAGRFLGDSRLFFVLARYNGIDVPDSTIAGRTLMVPRRARAVAAVRRRPAVVVRAPTVAAAVRDTAPPARDPAGANRLRAAALQAMDGGAIDRAVGLFRHAEQLDPGNSAIQAELGRAERVQLALRSRP